MKKKIFKGTLLAIFLYCGLNLFSVHSQYLTKRNIKNQIHYLSHKIHNGGDEAMQNRYPEGYVFCHALLALSIIEFDQRTKDDDQTQAYVNTIESSITQLLSPKAHSSFDASLDLKYGAFYVGWTNYTLKQYIHSPLFKHSKNKSYFINAYQNFSEQILTSLSQNPEAMATYQESIWPNDNLQCLVSLKDSTILKYRDRTYKKLKPMVSDGGLFNHSNYEDQPRGSSQALTLYFYQMAFPTEAAELNETFKQQFAKNILGFQFIKEYLDANQEQDIDSGPIVFNIGSVATLMNIKTQNAFCDKPQNKLTWGLLNMMGVPVSIGNEKYYLFQKEIMFDLFMLWCGVDMLEEG